MLWLIFALFSYFFSAVSSILDKFLLTGIIEKPKTYAFYIALLGFVLALICLPFAFEIPKATIVGISFISGIIWIFALVFFFEGLKKYEPSLIVTAIGGLTPLFLFLLNYLYFQFFKKENFSVSFFKILSLFLLILGSILMNIQRKRRLEKESFKISLFCAPLFAISLFLAKHIFLNLSFVKGFIWTRLGIFLGGLFLLFSKELRDEFFSKKSLFFKPKGGFLFLLNQLIGGVSGILQVLAIYFVPLIYLPFVSALEGTKYMFLFILAIFLSKRAPHIFGQEKEKSIIIQRSFAILFLLLGLFLFSLK